MHPVQSVEEVEKAKEAASNPHGFKSLYYNSDVLFHVCTHEVTL
jgi:hypothetical protein